MYDYLCIRDLIAIGTVKREQVLLRELGHVQFQSRINITHLISRTITLEGASTSIMSMSFLSFSFWLRGRLRITTFIFGS